MEHIWDRISAESWHGIVNIKHEAEVHGSRLGGLPAQNIAGVRPTVLFMIVTDDMISIMTTACSQSDCNAMSLLAWNNQTCAAGELGHQLSYRAH